MKITRLLLALTLLSLAAPSGAGPASGNLESEVLVEINLLRTQPQQYAGFLQKKTGLMPPSGPRVPMFMDDAAAVKEAVAALRAQPALNALQASAGLADTARDLVNQLGPAGLTSAPGGASMDARLGRHGHITGASGECLSYGQPTARDIIIDLVIDADFPERDDRKVLLEPKMNLAGVACGPHKQYESMCVIDLAQDFAK